MPRSSFMAIPALCGVLAAMPQDAGGTGPVGIIQPQVWLAPQGLNPPWPRAADFSQMFQPDAPWNTAAAHTQVFKLYAGYVQHAPQEEIDRIVSDLSRRGLAIALESGVMNVPPDPPSGCGGWGNVEGYGTVAMARKIAQKIKAAHGEIRYIAMDEPLYYGHYYTHVPGKGTGCHSSIEEVVALAAPTLKAYIDAFPAVQIGDVEPPLFVDDHPDWQQDLSKWATEFHASLGKPLAFMHLDVEWAMKNGVRDAVQVYNFCQQLRHQGLLDKIGLIYNGTPRDTSDQMWVQNARDHILVMEGQYRLRPDHVIFQSWQAYPTHAMPDTATDTLSGLVNYYFSPPVQARRATP